MRMTRHAPATGKVLLQGPFLGLLQLSVALRALISAFICPRVRRDVRPHPLALLINDLFFHIVLPCRLVALSAVKRNLPDALRPSKKFKSGIIPFREVNVKCREKVWPKHSLSTLTLKHYYIEP